MPTQAVRQACQLKLSTIDVSRPTFKKRLKPLIYSLNIEYQKGVMRKLPRRQYMPNFQAFSRSLVRA